MGSDFGSCSFVIERGGDPTVPGTFKSLFSKQGEVQSNDELARNLFDDAKFPNFKASSREFLQVPSAPIAYWLTSRFRKLFATARPLETFAKPRQGIATADNDRFLRRWYEVSADRSCFACSSRSDAINSGRTWFPYNKGGDFRKWYGNNEFVVNWRNDGEEIYAFRPRSVIRNPEFFFKEGITWTDISISSFGARFQPCGFLLM